MVNHRPRMTIIAPSASPEEAAAVVAALEQFMRQHSVTLAPQGPRIDPWRRSALLEGTGQAAEEAGAWGDAHRWGSLNP
jgi:hypothetical protein